jgi:hypothetical protein
VCRESLILQLSECTSEGGTEVFQGSEDSSKCTRMGAKGMGNSGRAPRAWESLEDQAWNHRGAELGMGTRTKTKTKTKTKT